MLAVQQNQRGNMGAAEAIYIMASSLLIPASQDLEVRSELAQHMRMQLKAKMQREAAATLDRGDGTTQVFESERPRCDQLVPDHTGYNKSRATAKRCEAKRKCSRKEE